MAEQASRTLANWLGYLSPEELDLLKEMARQCPDTGVFINIGAGAGTSALGFREERPNADIYTVDISTGGPLGGLESERNAFAGLGFRPTEQVLGDSHAVGKGWSGPKADVLMIDADHSEAGCTADIEAWLPHLKKGGLVLFHDYGSPNWPGVKVSVDRLMAGYEEVKQAKTLKVFKNKKLKSSKA